MNPIARLANKCSTWTRRASVLEEQSPPHSLPYCTPRNADRFAQGNRHPWTVLQ